MLRKNQLISIFFAIIYMFCWNIMLIEKEKNIFCFYHNLFDGKLLFSIALYWRAKYTIHSNTTTSKYN